MVRLNLTALEARMLAGVISFLRVQLERNETVEAACINGLLRGMKNKLRACAGRQAVSCDDVIGSAGDLFALWRRIAVKPAPVEIDDNQEA
jgi:hypothetical protein